MKLSFKSTLGILCLFIIATGFIVWNTKPADPKALPHVTIGIQTSPAMALVMVAKDKGFFEKQGLDVEIKEFTAGKFALEAFLGGSLDFAVSGDVPVALAALHGSTFVIPAQVVRETTNEVRVVARKDGDLTNASAYFHAEKRTLATSIGGGPEFFTYEFLNKLGILKDEVEIVSQSPKDMPAALASGSVDAIAIFDPVAYVAEKQLGDQAISFTDRDIYSELYIIEAKDSVKTDAKNLESLLRALIEAETFTRENPEDAKAIVMNYTKLDKETLDSIWSSFDFRISLTPQLLEYWNREADWARDTGKVSKETATPDFQSMIFSTPLTSISPAAVEL